MHAVIMLRRRRLAEVQTLLAKEVVLWNHGYLAMPQVRAHCSSTTTDSGTLVHCPATMMSIIGTDAFVSPLGS